MVTLQPAIHTTRPLANRIDRLQTHLQRQHGVDPASIRVVRAPLRISPLGAHIDHQLGRVMGMAVDRAVLLAFAPTTDGSVHVESLDFPTSVHFSLDEIPPHQKGDWGNYLRGAALALQRTYPLPYGMIGVLDRDMPIGGLSSSAAVTIAYLLALEAANELIVTPHENINPVTRREHEYVGLNNGILDQTSILFSRRNHLTHIDCQTRGIEPIPTAAAPEQVAVLAVHSGVTKALVGTSYNNRVAECQAAARQLLTRAGLPVSDDPRLRQVDAAWFAETAHELEEPLRRRATHFFSEMARVAQGQAAWQAGDIVRFGELVTASGASSITNYEAGCPQLITLYEILAETPGVYGVRFSGAGFRGSCLALIDPAQQAAIADRIHQRYPVAHPDIADAYSVHLCQPDDSAGLIG